MSGLRLISDNPAPYGDNPERKKWEQRLGFTYIPDGRCIHWLKNGKKCKKSICDGGHGIHQWMDHVSGYTTSDGKRVLISQPYQVYDFPSLDMFCRKNNIKASITGLGWYGNGTVCLSLYEYEAHDQIGP